MRWGVVRWGGGIQVETGWGGVEVVVVGWLVGFSLTYARLAGQCAIRNFLISTSHLHVGVLRLQ